MKRKLLLISLFVLLLLYLCGCGTEYQNADENKYNNANGFFTELKNWSDRRNTYKIVYDNETKVEYLIISGGYHMGITPLYNEDGTVKIYKGDE